VKKDNKSSRLAKAMLETAKDMQQAGILDEKAYAKITMRHVGTKELSEVQPLTGKDIRAIRERAHMSQAVFAHHLNVTVGYVSQLELSDNQMAYLGIIESGLNEIISPFLQKMSSRYARFTSTEVQIINMIKGGKTTKEIAELLHIGKATVDSHRNSIRKKLGLGNQKINLQTYLLSL